MTGLLFRLYPRRLRREHGEEIRSFVDERMRRARGRGRFAAMAEWGRLFTDAVGARMAERRSARQGRQGRGETMQNWALDVRYATRRLTRTPGFTLGAVALIAVAIGANAAAFAVVSRTILTPPPFERPDEVVAIYQDSDDGEPNSTSFPAYRDMTARTDVFASVSATSPDDASLEWNGAQEHAAIEYATASLMETIGRQPARGRWFGPEMDAPGAGNFAVVSYHTWENRFGSDPAVVGRTLRLNGQPVTVIGIGPRGFNGIGGFLVTDFWLSISSTPVGGQRRVANLDRREDHWYDVKARLAPGVTIVQARQAMDALALELADAFPELNEGRDITVFAAKDVRLHPEVDQALFGAAGVLTAVVLLVLVLAATNLGSLLLVRGMARTSEVAVRQALGAASGRVARLFLAETLVLSAVGGVVGVVLARWLVSLLSLVPFPGPFESEMDLTVDWRVLLFSVLLILVTGLFFGLAPALQSLRTDVAGVLREESRSQSAGRRGSRIRNVLVAVQVAVSLILVAGAGLMVRSLAEYARVDPGFEADRVAWIRVDPGEGGFGPEERVTVADQIRERIAALPGVTTVALATRVPLQGGGTTTTVVEEYEPPSGTGSVELNWTLVSPEYFEAMGLRTVDGRAYTVADQTSDERTVVVSEAAAQQFWGGQDPVGRRIRPQGVLDGWRPVIGVVSDARVRSLGEGPTPLLYYVMGTAVPGAFYVVARTAVEPSSLLRSMRAEVQAVSPRIPVTDLRTGRDHVGAALAVPRTSAGVLGIFSLLALLLASVGIYTIVSFSVAGRLPEIGIRVALGAARGRVVRLVVSEVAATVALGLALGVGLILLAGRGIGPEVMGVRVLDPLNLLTAVVVLGAVVAVASYLPARRAARVDPVNALRG